MKKYSYLLAAALTVSVLGSCADDREALSSGEGRVMINATINADVKAAVSRDGASLAEELAPTLKLWISNDKGVVRTFDGLPEGEIALLSGDYLVEAWAGDSVSASWDKRWFKGAAEFAVTKGALTQVDLTCTIANVVVAVEYGDDVKDVLSSPTIEVGHNRGHLTFEGFDVDGKYAYFMMPSSDRNLSWTLTGTKTVDGVTTYTRTNVIENVEAGHLYTFKVSCSASDDGSVGGGFLDIAVDDTQIDQNEVVQIATAPTIVGAGFDIDSPLYCEPGLVGPRTVWIFGASALESVLVESSQLGVLLGIDGADDIDLLGMSDSFAARVSAAGLAAIYNVDAADGTSRMKITFADALTSKMMSGTYSIAITAKDAEGRTAKKVVVFDVSGNPLSLADVSPSDLSTTTSAATVSGTINNADMLDQDVFVNYRPKNSRSRADWTSVKASVSGNRFSARLTGLAAGTVYEWTATVGDFTTGAKTFATEAALQLPNCGFEGWQTSSNPYLIYAAGDEMFWDSGNHGSSKMRKNVTTPDADFKHGGNYSIKLSSQFVGMGSIGKFAAGNVFVGEYLGTDGTDGILGFGRPFTGRPAKLHGYVRYNPQAIDRIDVSDAPAEYVKGQMDKGIIYMALLDDYTETYSGKAYPVIIKTKQSERRLFDKNSAHVLAYGEKVFTEDTGDGWVEFEIVLDYRNTDVRPSYILLTASASKGGDYFAGGPSTMWLDDLELIYE